MGSPTHRGRGVGGNQVASVAQVRRTRIWPLLSRARTLDTPVFLDPVVTMGTSRVSAPLVATPRGSVLVVAVGSVGGTKHIWGICQHTFCLGAPTVGPGGPTSQKLLRAPRRPGKAAGWTWANGTPAWVRYSRSLPSSRSARREGRLQESYAHTRSNTLILRMPCRRPIKATRSGTATHGSLTGSKAQ